MSIKAVTIFILFFFSFYPSFAQPTYSSKDKKAIKQYEEALLYYDAGKFDEAKKYLDKSLSEDPRFIEPHMMLAYIFRDSKQYQKAIDEVNLALAIDPEFFSGNYFFLAEIQMEVGKYKEAKRNFDLFLQKPSQNKEMRLRAQKSMVNCDFAETAVLSPVPFEPVNAGPGLNSKYDEYFPCITADEQTFLFTRKLPKGSIGKGWQEDFYVSNKVENKWADAYSIGPKINTETNEGAPSLSADGRILFYVVAEDMPDDPNVHNYGLGRKGYGSCDIFYSIKEGNDWSKPKNAGPGVNSVHWETQPSFSSDGKTLYFIRGLMQQHTIHNPEIYMSVLGANGQFGKAVKLSDVINTKENEESVFIHPDNQTLYFSSDGHPGMGGLDIFMSRRQPNGQWGKPVNLGYPINTSSDENSLLVSRDGEIAYFASDRAGGLGGLDIYSFKLYDQVKPTKTIYVKGRVFDAVTKAPLDAEVEAVDLETDSTVVKWISNKANGEFLICLPLNKNYAFNTSKAGYLFHSENYALTESKDYKPIIINIPLSPIAKDSTVILRNVFFDTDKFNLKDISKAELNKLADFLSKNPSLKIELGGHTDNVGDKKHNQVLSENRAKSVMEFLAANGIAKERLTSKGYGDTKPVVANDSDEHRQMNRRTEFKIIAK